MAWLYIDNNCFNITVNVELLQVTTENVSLIFVRIIDKHYIGGTDEQININFLSFIEEPSISSVFCNRTWFKIKNIWLLIISDREFVVIPKYNQDIVSKTLYSTMLLIVISFTETTQSYYNTIRMMKILPMISRVITFVSCSVKPWTWNRLALHVLRF